MSLHARASVAQKYDKYQNLMFWSKYGLLNDIVFILHKYEVYNAKDSKIFIKGVKKVCYAIKVSSYYFSYNVSNDINVTGFFKVDSPKKK